MRGFPHRPTSGHRRGSRRWSCRGGRAARALGAAPESMRTPGSRASSCRRSSKVLADAFSIAVGLVTRSSTRAAPSNAALRIEGTPRRRRPRRRARRRTGRPPANTRSITFVVGRRRGGRAGGPPGFRRAIRLRGRSRGVVDVGAAGLPAVSCADGSSRPCASRAKHRVYASPMHSGCGVPRADTTPAQGGEIGRIFPPRPPSRTSRWRPPGAAARSRRACSRSAGRLAARPGSARRRSASAAALRSSTKRGAAPNATTEQVDRREVRAREHRARPRGQQAGPPRRAGSSAADEPRVASSRAQHRDERLRVDAEADAREHAGVGDRADRLALGLARCALTRWRVGVRIAVFSSRPPAARPEGAGRRRCRHGVLRRAGLPRLRACWALM